MARFSAAFVERIVETDQSELRFERFSLELASKLEGGAPVLPTSRTRDLGTDGRGRVGGVRILVCATTTGRDGLVRKALSDLKKPGPQIEGEQKIYFFSNQRLTEEAHNGILKQATDAIPERSDVVFLSLVQVSALVERFPEVFEEHYRAEYREFIETLESAASEPAGDTPPTGLLLALQTIASSDSQSIRDDVYTSLILRAVEDRGRATLAEISHGISTTLRLAAGLRDEILQKEAARLDKSGWLTVTDGRFELTDAGRDLLRGREIQGAGEMLLGRGAMREALEERLGYRLADDHFSRLWEALSPRLAAGFYGRGQELVSFVSASLKGDTKPTELRSRVAITQLLEDLEEAVRSVTDGPEAAGEIVTALGDVFEERDCPAHRWLLGLCAAYVALCSLGLEDTTGREVAALIRSTELVLDTDIVLSLLGVAEPAHHSVETVIRRWIKLGGSVYLSPEVAIEAAHHAWIAERDLEEVRRWFPGTALERDRYVENVFVRSFGLLVQKGDAKKSHWPAYIGQFRGVSEKDATQVWASVGDYGVSGLPDGAPRDEALQEEIARTVREEFLSSNPERDLKISEDKARRDCSLYERILLRRRRLQSDGRGGSCVLVTSSRRLLKLEGHLGLRVGAHVAMSLAESVFLLSLLPGTTIGLSALEVFLFETYPQRFGSPVERTVLRVIHDAGLSDLPWAKRRVLFEKFRQHVFENARRAGLDTSRPEVRDQMRSEALSVAGAAATAKAIVHALGEIAATDRREAEIERLQEEVVRLEDELKRRGGR